MYWCFPISILTMLQQFVWQVTEQDGFEMSTLYHIKTHFISMRQIIIYFLISPMKLDLERGVILGSKTCFKQIVDV
jgi:hypothetical protein